MFYNRLFKVYKHRSRQAKRMGISCYRIYDHDIPEYPLCIEQYEQIIYVAEYLRRHGMDDNEHTAWMLEVKQIICSIFNCSNENIFIRERRKHSHRSEQQYEKIEATEQAFIVTENALKFIIKPGTYLDTGLFLDHRLTREKIHQISTDKKVLNLFCYTGSFSVYAAAGKAISVTSVDMSNTYLNWARQNFSINNFKGKNFHFIQADVLQWLQTQQPNQYDLVVVDPPTFSNSKRMKTFFDVQQDHVHLLNQVFKTVIPGGTVIFSNNYSKFMLDEKALKAQQIKDITKTTTPFDFEGKLQRYCFEITV